MLPKTMLAAVLIEINRPLQLLEINLPKQLEVGQVLVKIHASGVCGSQLGEIAGVKGADKFLPHLLGHEGSGTVVAIGPGVRYVKVGDPVILHWRKGLGIDALPAHFEWQQQKINAGAITTFSEYSIVSENRLTVISSECDLKVAALFGCALTTGFGLIENNADLKMGESIVVLGAGGVGLSIIQAAALRSAYPIVAIDLYDEKLALAKKLGATHVIKSTNEITVLADAIDAIFNRDAINVFVENTGLTAHIELGYAKTDIKGRVILVGVPKDKNNISIHTLPLHFGKKLTGSHGGECLPAEDIPRWLRLYQQKRLKLKEIITDVYPLVAINDAIQDLRSGKITGRALIKM
jgi:S-(hydroxymethyl)glutathione dehydrogenase/alcohol dehydrogenase